MTTEERKMTNECRQWLRENSAVEYADSTVTEPHLKAIEAAILAALNDNVDSDWIMAAVTAAIDSEPDTDEETI